MFWNVCTYIETNAFSWLWGTDGSPSRVFGESDMTKAMMAVEVMLVSAQALEILQFN